MPDALSPTIRTALSHMAAGVQLQRIRAGWFLFPPLAALPIRVTQPEAHWLLSRHLAAPIRRTPTRGTYAITDAGRLWLEEDAR